MDISTIESEITAAYFNFAIRHSVGLQPRENSICRGGPAIGSGTLVRYRGTVYVLTADHYFDRCREVELPFDHLSALFAPRRSVPYKPKSREDFRQWLRTAPRRDAEASLDIAVRRVLRSDDPDFQDIALIEFDPAVIPPQAIIYDIAEVHPAPAKIGEQALLVGIAEETSVNLWESRAVLTQNSGYASLVRLVVEEPDPAGWVDRWGNSVFDPRHNFALEFDFPSELEEKGVLGMSGCGVWRVDVEGVRSGNKIWHPKITLLGTLSSQHRGRHKLKAIRVDCMDALLSTKPAFEAG